MAVLLAAALFYSGMKDYVKVGKTDTAVVELYGDYPAVNLAKQIWENYQSSDEITDFCFVWNGGVQVVTNPEDFRQTNARVTGIVGMAALYDRQAALLEENDETMLSTLNEIKLGQKTQEQVNIKLDKTLDAIQKEREIDEKNKKENDKNIRDMKMWVLGLVGTIFGSLIIALLRMLMGI